MNDNVARHAHPPFPLPPPTSHPQGFIEAWTGVVNADQQQAQLLQASFGDDFYVGNLVRAAEQLDMDNVISPTAGWKANFIWKKTSAWDDEAFGRRVPITLAGRIVWVISAEDLVVAKLLWSQSSQSEMQLRDVANVVGVATLDWDYLNPWIDDLGLRHTFDSLS